VFFSKAGDCVMEFTDIPFSGAYDSSQQLFLHGLSRLGETVILAPERSLTAKRL